MSATSLFDRAVATVDDGMRHVRNLARLTGRSHEPEPEPVRDGDVAVGADGTTAFDVAEKNYGVSRLEDGARSGVEFWQRAVNGDPRVSMTLSTLIGAKGSRCTTTLDRLKRLREAHNLHARVQARRKGQSVEATNTAEPTHAELLDEFVGATRFDAPKRMREAAARAQHVWGEERQSAQGTVNGLVRVFGGNLEAMGPRTYSEVEADMEQAAAKVREVSARLTAAAAAIKGLDVAFTRGTQALVEKVGEARIAEAFSKARSTVERGDVILEEEIAKIRARVSAMDCDARARAERFNEMVESAQRSIETRRANAESLAQHNPAASAVAVLRDLHAEVQRGAEGFRTLGQLATSHPGLWPSGFSDDLLGVARDVFAEHADVFASILDS